MYICVSLSFFLCVLLMYTPLTFDSSPLRRRRHTANGVRSFDDVCSREQRLRGRWVKDDSHRKGLFAYVCMYHDYNCYKHHGPTGIESGFFLVAAHACVRV